LSDKHCAISNTVKPAMFMVLTSDMVSTTQQQHFNSRATGKVINLNHHIDNAIRNDSWFNLFYSLPTIYQKDVLAQAKPPLLFQAIKRQDLATSFTVIGKKPNRDKQSIDTLWFKPYFKKQIELADISSLIFADKLNNIQPGLHVIYFPKGNTYQFELFMDALLLAQKRKTTKDIIWISSVGNEKQKTILSNKPSTLIWPTAQGKKVDEITSHMDLQPTLLKNWLACDGTDYSYALANGRDLLSLEQDRVIANTMKNGIVVFNKDKSVMIDQNGHFQSYSRQLEAPIDEKSNFPLLIDAVHFIKQFSDQAPK